MPPPTDVPAAPASGEPDGLVEEHALAVARVRAYLAADQAELAVGVADETLRQARRTGDGRGEAASRLMLLLVRTALGHDPQEISELAREVAAALQAAGDSAGALEAMRISFDMQLKQEQFHAAKQMAQAILQASERSGDAAAVAAAHLAVAQACMECGERDEATQTANKAAALYEQVGSKAGKASCLILSGRICHRHAEYEDAVETAKRARGLYREAGDLRGQASALQIQAGAHLASGANVDALRAAEEAGKLWRAVGDLASEVDSLLVQAEAKVNICDERSAVRTFATSSTLLKAAEAALTAARAHRSRDRACLGAALLIHARVLLQTSATKSAWLAAGAAARAFHRAGDAANRARALLLAAEADVAQGYLLDAQGHFQVALAIYYDKAADDQDRSRALEVGDKISRAMGMLTQAELEEERQQREYESMLALQMQMQHQQQQGQFQGMQPQQIIPIQQQHYGAGDAGQIQRHGGAPLAAFKRDGASPLQVSAGMDPAIVQAKVAELAAQIIGDSEAIELDLPLMEAGLTSNTAVLLRDELSKDLPGISLPPTLIFDYPSIGAITEYVLEQSKM